MSNGVSCDTLSQSVLAMGSLTKVALSRPSRLYLFSFRLAKVPVFCEGLTYGGMTAEWHVVPSQVHSPECYRRKRPLLRRWCFGNTTIASKEAQGWDILTKDGFDNRLVF